MKTTSLLRVITAAVSLTISQVHLRAADVPRGCGAEAPADANVVLKQIELKVALAQYEKVLAAIYDANIQVSARQLSDKLTGDEEKEAARDQIKRRLLEDMREKLRDIITDTIGILNAEARARGEASAPRIEKPH